MVALVLEAAQSLVLELAAASPTRPPPSPTLLLPLLLRLIVLLTPPPPPFRFRLPGLFPEMEWLDDRIFRVDKYMTR
jgi:hypothetical protein